MCALRIDNSSSGEISLLCVIGTLGLSFHPCVLVALLHLLFASSRDVLLFYILSVYYAAAQTFDWQLPKPISTDDIILYPIESFLDWGGTRKYWGRSRYFVSLQQFILVSWLKEEAVAVMLSRGWLLFLFAQRHVYLLPFPPSKCKGLWKLPENSRLIDLPTV